MAYSKISDLFKGICDAIRSKDGTTAKINHQDIPTRIQSLNVTETVRLQQKSVTPGENAQTVKADTGYTALSQVNVEAIDSGYVGSGITRKSAQTYTPGTTDQTIAKDQYLTGVQTIKAIPPQYIIPSGTKNITENGTTDVTQYATVNVNVPTGGGGSSPQVYNGSFTANAKGEATVSCGFSPDVLIVRNMNGLFTDNGGITGVVSNACVVFDENSGTEHLGMIQSDKPDSGVTEVFFSRTETGADLRFIFQAWNWGGAVGMKNRSFDVTAIKYT